MAKAIGFKPAPTNQNKGYKTHGSFKNDGQKDGKHGAVKSVKEKVTPAHNVQTKMKMLAKKMFPDVATNRQARTHLAGRIQKNHVHRIILDLCWDWTIPAS